MTAVSAYERVRASFRSAFSELTEGMKQRILVALSGGGDSALLLHLLRETDSEIFAAHVNHGIRGKEADHDEIFCRDICHSLAVPFFSCKIDIPVLAKDKGIGIEETAREAHYEYLQEVAKEQSCSLIATAHNADDNLETILFHLTRGSGLKVQTPPAKTMFFRPLRSRA